MPPFVFQRNTGYDASSRRSIAGGPDLRYLHEFNDVGGRPDERLGSRGSFTPGVRIMSGGQSRAMPTGAEINGGKLLFPPPTLQPDLTGEARTNVGGGRPTERLGSHCSFSAGTKNFLGGTPRDVPLEPEINPGTVLFVSSTLKPDMSGEARTNVVGGRPTERLGSRGSFTPGVKKFLGGPPRDVPLEAEIDHGKVLFVSSTLKPDLSGEPRTNAVRPTERLGSRGSFTPGVRTMSGGPSRDVPLEAEIDHGKVLFVSATLKPDLSGEARTNVVGGRPNERLGSRGSFTPGTKRWRGGAARDVPLEAEIDHGKVLFVSSTLKPDMSGEARTNAVRPTERLGLRGSFTPGRRNWLGGQPRDIPAEREIKERGTILFPPPAAAAATARTPEVQLGLFAAFEDDDYGGFVETEVVEGCQAFDAVLDEDKAVFDNNDVVMVKKNSDVALAKKSNSGVFRRCGSDSQFSAGAALMSEERRPAF